MGLFDIFTGSSAKDAAAANAAEYRKYGTASLGDLDAGMAKAVPELDNAIGAYAPLSALGTKYGAGTDLYQDALGINGADGTARAQSAFTTSPGYQFQVDEAVDRGQRAAARFSPGGNEIDSVTRIASGLAGAEWDKYLGRLGQFPQLESGAVAGAAGGRAAGYGAKAGAYGNDAQNRVNLRGNVAGGIANSNTAAAQAQMNASGQFWNGLMALGGNVAKAFAPIPKVG
jgi:hypothetical protein